MHYCNVDVCVFMKEFLCYACNKSDNYEIKTSYVCTMVNEKIRRKKAIGPPIYLVDKKAETFLYGIIDQSILDFKKVFCISIFKINFKIFF